MANLATKNAASPQVRQFGQQMVTDHTDKLKFWIAATLPRTTREVGAWIARECGIEYQTRSGLIALLHRLDMEHGKPKAISRKLEPAKQTAFINDYEALMNRIEADETVVFADAVHPRSRARSPTRCDRLAAGGRKTLPSRSNRAADETLMARSIWKPVRL